MKDYKVSALWLHDRWDDIIDLKKGQDLVISPHAVGRCPSAIVQGVNRMLNGLGKEKLIRRIEWKVSVVGGMVRVRRL